MTLKQKNSSIQELNNKELSIQISLNGLSFCILNPLTQNILSLRHFKQAQKQTPFELLDTVKHLFNTDIDLNGPFDKITVIHVNELATLVPKALFNEDAIADYLKLNSKILKTDYITYDTILSNESINVYVPYVNVNNFIYEKYGDFTFKHFSTILIESLLAIEKNSNDTKLYINVNTNHFEIIALKEGKLLLYNTFEYITNNDFIYYILFTAEQLGFNPETLNLVFLGDIKEGDNLYNIVYKYIRHVSFGSRMDTFSFTKNPASTYSDFTLIKSL
ncbi:DUF3822 family protein [uncultured Lacinutrix sp.]|uniref:DUF3822 family protein n=1 Tax=uncultured Lacinutrix sp. TaxID=574032 RepID=UPI00260C8B74|nr:DUF3822 family protein [uncultured Lacinutrix sp.]